MTESLLDSDKIKKVLIFPDTESFIKAREIDKLLVVTASEQEQLGSYQVVLIMERRND